MSSPERLVYMANQIGSFFATQRSADPKTGIANHIEKFWEPRMREAIFAHIEHGGEGLQDIVRDALVALKAKRRS